MLPRVALLFNVTPFDDLPVAWLRVVNVENEQVVVPKHFSLLLTLEGLPGEAPVTGQLSWVEEQAVFPIHTTPALLELLSRLVGPERER
jgi:hypothetical protein